MLGLGTRAPTQMNALHEYILLLDFFVITEDSSFCIHLTSRLLTAPLEPLHALESLELSKPLNFQLCCRVHKLFICSFDRGNSSKRFISQIWKELIGRYLSEGALDTWPPVSKPDEDCINTCNIAVSVTNARLCFSIKKFLRLLSNSYRNFGRGAFSRVAGSRAKTMEQKGGKHLARARGHSMRSTAWGRSSQ